jgi:hypothetical protein
MVSESFSLSAGFKVHTIIFSLEMQYFNIQEMKATSTSISFSSVLHFHKPWHKVENQDVPDFITL